MTYHIIVWSIIWALAGLLTFIGFFTQRYVPNNVFVKLFLLVACGPIVWAMTVYATYEMIKEARRIKKAKEEGRIV